MAFRLIVPMLALTLCGLGVGQEPDSVDKVRESILKAVNELRADGKVAPLKPNAKLEAAAQKHAENMAKQQKLDHELDGKTPKDRVLAEGYKLAGAGENIVTIKKTKNASDPTPPQFQREVDRVRATTARLMHRAATVTPEEAKALNDRVRKLCAGMEEWIKNQK